MPRGLRGNMREKAAVAACESGICPKGRHSPAHRTGQDRQMGGAGAVGEMTNGETPNEYPSGTKSRVRKNPPWKEENAPEGTYPSLLISSSSALSASIIQPNDGGAPNSISFIFS